MGLFSLGRKKLKKYSEIEKRRQQQLAEKRQRNAEIQKAKRQRKAEIREAKRQRYLDKLQAKTKVLKTEGKYFRAVEEKRKARRGAARASRLGFFIQDVVKPRRKKRRSGKLRLF